MFIGTMLVGPNKPGLKRALDSLKACGVDEIYVLIDAIRRSDLALLEEYNCKIYERQWTWEFGQARQYLQKYVPSKADWQIFLDTDDEIPADSAQKIQQIVSSSPKAVYSMPYLYVINGQVVHGLHRIRLFPPEAAYWHMRAHEYLTFPAGVPLQKRNDISILHHWQQEEGRSLHYIQGLRKDMEEYPNSARIKFYLAQSLDDARQSEQAIEMYRAYLDAGGWSEERMKAGIRLSILLQRGGDLERALEAALQAAEETQNPRREAYQRIGEVYFAMENWEKAYQYFKQENQIPFPHDATLYICMDHYGKKPLLSLSYACDKLGKYSEGLECCRQILAKTPDDPDAKNNAAYFSKKLAEEVKQVEVVKSDKPKAYFYTGRALENWTADTPKTTGIGGLETSNAVMAGEFQKLGWEVTLFCQCEGQEGKHQGIQHMDYSKFHAFCDTYPPDIIFCSRYANLIDQPLPGYKVLWSHDLHYGDDPRQSPIYLTPERVASFDHFIFQSPFHLGLNMQKYRIPEEKCYLTRLGIDLPELDIDRERHRCIYASSPDRGLHRLLNVWPAIRKQVPEAELYIYYGFDNILSQARLRSPEAYEQTKRKVDTTIAEIKAIEGVNYVGRVPQDKLAEAFAKASIWTYPTKFLETMCITALTACNYGVVPVTSNIGALQTTVGEYGVLLDGDPDSFDYQMTFVDEVVQLLWEDTYWEKWSKAARLNIDREGEHGKYWTWEMIAKEWNEYFREKIS